MLNKKEIQENYTKLNKNSIITGITQAEERLRDSLETKKNLESKTFTLLNSYLLATIAIFSVAAYCHENKINTFFTIPPLILSGTALLIGCVYLILSLSVSNYGTLGRLPDTWLREGVVNDENEDNFILNMAHILHDYQDRILTSDESNHRRSKNLNRAIYCGLFSAIIFSFLTLSYIIDTLKYLFFLLS